jgi:zinc transport system permease protein
MDEFLLRVLFGSFGVALVAGPLGAFIVWRRMAYFGDTLSHSGLLGIVFGIVLDINPALGIAVTCLGVALALVLLQRQQSLATDTLLGIISHTTLSLGLVTLASLETVRIDLSSYLFGDILSINSTDLYWIWGSNLFTISILFWLWRPLLAATVHEELAYVEGIPVFRVRLIFMLLIAIVIAVAMKVVGILLITSLLIIPAAAAQRFAQSPESMAVLASFFGCLAIGLGLCASLQWDTPAGPSVVIATTILFIFGSTISRWLRP